MTAMKKKNPTTYGTESELAKWLDHMIEPETTEAIFENCFEYLENGDDEDTLGRMAKSVTQTLDNLWKKIKCDQPDYDCHRGCSWCCDQNVSVTLPELFHVFSYLRQTLDKKQLKDLHKKCLKRAAKIAGKTTNQRFDERIACAFLENNVCTIHSARPLQCRGGFSEEEDYCRNLLENREQTQLEVKDGDQIGKFLIAPKLLYNSAQIGIIHAMKDFGLNGRTFELTVAMAILMRQIFDNDTGVLVENHLESAILEEKGGCFSTSNVTP